MEQESHKQVNIAEFIAGSRALVHLAADSEGKDEVLAGMCFAASCLLRTIAFRLTENLKDSDNDPIEPPSDTPID